VNRCPAEVGWLPPGRVETRYGFSHGRLDPGGGLVPGPYFFLLFFAFFLAISPSPHTPRGQPVVDSWVNLPLTEVNDRLTRG
jgi:hypothetical protein